MRSIFLLSCGIILIAHISIFGIVSSLGPAPTPTIDSAEIEAFNSIDNASLAIYAGQNALQNGRYEEALEQYTIATEYDPSWIAAWYLKAFSLEKLNRSEKALIAVNQALSIDETDRDSNNLKADILDNLGRADEAVQFRKRAVPSSTTSLAPVSVTPTNKSSIPLIITITGMLVCVLIWRKNGGNNGE